MATTQTDNRQTLRPIMIVKGHELRVGMDIVVKANASGTRAIKTSTITKIEPLGKYDRTRILVNNHDVYNVVSLVEIAV